MHRPVAIVARTVLIALLATAVSIRGTAWAGSLAATKASQVVTLTNGATACMSPNSKIVNLVANADGSLAPFSIPAGEVLVVTGLDWTVYGATASHTAQGALGVEGTGGSVNVFVDAAIADSAGTASKASLVPNVIVKPGATLCVSGDGTNVAGRVHGFRAKDR